MIDRREFLVGSCLGAGILLTHGCTSNLSLQAQGPTVLGPDYSGPLPADLYTRGTKPPLTEEEAVARRIIRRAPTSSPIAVMQYFAGLREVNRDGEAYNAGWATRWNPVIVEFYTATDNTYTGDTTAWCAAFLNWCLARANYKGGTRSTVSGTFRNAPGRTTTLARGDIIVFKKTGGASCRGHVGLYVGKTRTGFRVLGGNQTNVNGHSSINVREVPFPGSHLALHSFHSISAFRQPLQPLPTC
ncbi:CHAP domain-containing protein [Ensifer sp. ENS12]|uniref:CHAP domain-containing protein n=1 Tax=Ensifer sp. ENS12 TaxID=2854774 RepID=UPI002815B42B|nr:CHAP domain-containing protein [Ensifer sp. ENS12]